MLRRICGRRPITIMSGTNTDNEMNFLTTPDPMVDGYQLAFNQFLGTLVSTNADRKGVGFFTEAHVDAEFGDQANWNLGGSAVGGAALQGIVVAQNNGATGGVAEISFPWANFNADATLPPTGDYNRNGTVDAADYPLWRDTLGQTVDPAGSGADGDGNGTVEQADYDIWRAAFGTIGYAGHVGPVSSNGAAQRRYLVLPNGPDHQRGPEQFPSRLQLHGHRTRR